MNKLNSKIKNSIQDTIDRVNYSGKFPQLNYVKTGSNFDLRGEVYRGIFMHVLHTLIPIFNQIFDEHKRSIRESQA